MGLLDGLLGDSFEDPRTVGLLSLVQSLTSNRRPLQGLSGGLLGYSQAIAAGKQAKQLEELKKLQLEQTQLSTQAQRRQMERQSAMEALPGQFMRPGAMPPSMDARDIGQPGEQPIQTQLDLPGYANALFRYDPATALQLQNSLRKDTTPIISQPGAIARDARGNILWQNPAETKEETTNDIKEYRQAVSQGFKGTLLDYQLKLKRAGAPNTSVSYGAPVAGVDSNGNPVFFQPDKGGGAPAIIPGVKPQPRETPAALKEKMASNAVTLDKIGRAISLVDKNPGALGLKNYMGDVITQRADPGGVEVRAMISDIAGQKIHDRSGAAVTVGELARLKPYIPNVTDTPSVVKQKLYLFQNEYQAMQQELNSGASIEQASRGAGGPNAGGGWSARRIGG